MLTAEIQGVRQLRQRFSRSPILVEQAARDTLQAATFIAEGTAKEKAPIDDGFLRGSIHSKVGRVGSEMIGVVGTNLEYAPYQEHGTGIYGPKGAPITPKRGKFLRFKTKSGQVVFARSVKGTRAKKFMAAGMEAVKHNLGKIRSIGMMAVRKRLGF